MPGIEELERRIAKALGGRDDLLKNPQFAEMAHPLAGHCYVASEVLFHLTGGYDRWYVCRAEVGIHTALGYLPVTHWYLEDRETGDYVDVTGKQFTGFDVDIAARRAAGTRTGFMTKEPSKRAQTILREFSVDISTSRASV